MSFNSSMRFLGAVLIVGIAALPSRAGSIAVTGNSYVVPLGSTVAAQFFVSNADAAAASDIEGMTFTVQIADGIGTSPKITALDLLAGTIWNGHVSAANIFTPSGGNQLQYQSRDVLTDSPGDYVDANGLLGTVTVDTTGAAAGTYALKLIGTKTVGRDSALLNGLGNTTSSIFGEGQIIVNVPEPHAFLLAYCGIVAALAVRRRKLHRTGC